jgi:hypothetical protein
MYCARPSEGSASEKRQSNMTGGEDANSSSASINIEWLIGPPRFALKWKRSSCDV